MEGFFIWAKAARSPSGPSALRGYNLPVSIKPGQAETRLTWARLASTIFGIDLRSLAAFRIGVASVLLIDLALRWPDLIAHYTSEGVLPQDRLPAVFGDLVRLSPHYYAAASPIAQGALFVLALLAAIGLLVGYRTQLMAIVSWVLLAGLHRVNPAVLGGGDAVLRLVLFWAMFLPLGARFSIDARRSPSRLDWPNRHASIAGAALLLQIAFVYWFTALMKTGEPWRDGTALGIALNIDHFVNPFGRWLAEFDGALRAITYGTLLVELAGPLLAFVPFWNSRFRLGAVGLFIAFHVLIALCMDVGLFPLSCIAAWLVFLPGSFWDWLKRDRAQAIAPAAVHAAGDGAWRLPPVVNLGIAALLLYVASVNVCQLPWPGARHLLLTPLTPAGSVLLLDQRWAMFAPEPRPLTYGTVAAATLADGSRVDLIDEGPILPLTPAEAVAGYPNSRWATYLLNLISDNPQDVERRAPLVDYLVRRWHDHHAGAERRIEHVELYVLVQALDKKGRGPLQRVPLPLAAPASISR